MRQQLTILISILPMLFTMPAWSGGNSENPNAQCEMIAALTGDFYANKQQGMSKQETRTQGMPEFSNNEFLRTVDLAINMAYAFDDGLEESRVESQVYDECLEYQ